jgi:hypothetical protein
VQNVRSQSGSNENEKSNEEEPATVKAAETVARKLFGHHLENSEKGRAGNAVHYATGGTCGAVYGLAAELAPGVTAAVGVPFGTAVWLAIHCLDCPRDRLNIQFRHMSMRSLRTLFTA